MTDAPERIWAEETIGGQYSVGQKSGRWYSSEFNGDRETEYTRSDLIPAMLAEARAKGIREAAEAVALNAWKHVGDDAHSKGMDMGARDQNKRDHAAILALLDQPSGDRHE